MQVLARDEDRPQDSVDLKALLEVATPEDIRLAREAIALIMARGYNRGRELDTDLQNLLNKRLW